MLFAILELSDFGIILFIVAVKVFPVFGDSTAA